MKRALTPLVLAVLFIALAGCASLRRLAPWAGSGVDDPDPWQETTAVAPVASNPDLCEARWETPRPPAGPADRIGLRRIAPCSAAPTEAHLLYLPGTHMNGTLAILDEQHEFRLYLARRGVAIWSLDYRTHFVSPASTDLDFMTAWTGDVFLGDVRAALDFVRRSAAGTPVFVAGFSRGASFACALAGAPGGKEASALAGLVILDGVAPGVLPARADTASRPVALDVGSQRLPFAERQALLDTVIHKPQTPSTDPAFPTAAHQLAHILYTSRTFGGRGGLSDAMHGRASIELVARLLASYDRYWPGAATPEAVVSTGGGAAVDPAAVPPLPVFAVASTNMGAGFTRAVEASARRFDDDPTVIVLEGSGHLDILVGIDVLRDVLVPLDAWIAEHTPPQTR